MRAAVMKLCYLANAASIHTRKWALHFARRGYDVHLVSLHPPPLGETLTGVSVHYLGAKNRTARWVPGWRYLLMAGRVRALVRRLRPHILHAHYATGYGLLGSLAGFHPYVLSVWGSDVLQFPRTSPIHRALVRFNLGRADYICSTSRHMARLTRAYTTREVVWTPFGVDCTQFNGERPAAARDDGAVTIGTVRPLEQGYGIEHLIHAVAALRARPWAAGLRLLIVGDGTERRPLERLARALGIEAVTEFVGTVPHDRVPEYLRRFTIYVAPSVHEESFGVAVLEASACGVPVVASGVGGLPEVVEDGVTGLLVPPADHVALADALEGLVQNRALRRQMGEEGRRFVRDRYAWNRTALAMEGLYESIMSPPAAGG